MVAWSDLTMSKILKLLKALQDCFAFFSWLMIFSLYIGLQPSLEYRFAPLLLFLMFYTYREMTRKLSEVVGDE